MRSIKLSPVVAGAAILLIAPTATSASATGRDGRLDAPRLASAAGCHVRIFAEPRVVTGGESVQVFGQLACPGGANVAGQPVTIFERSAGAPGAKGFKEIGTVSTGPGGFYSIVPSPVTADSFFYARALGARSGTRAVRVAPQVTLAAPGAPDGSQLRTGRSNRVTFTGTVTPGDAGATVVLQRENSTSFEEWGAIQLGVVGPGGTYSLTHTFVIPGDANIRVVVRKHGKFSVRGISNTLSYVISQRQNPKLTLNASADPISYGQTVTLSGVVAGGANQKVTLLSHPRGQKVFTKLTEGTTDGSGAYSFVQKPLQNTAYKVTSGKVSSAILVEGVKYVLTAGASATTVQSGQSVTFSGTVTPGQAGKIVYLERENAFGGGFHVVDVGTVSAASTYAITHFLFGNGKQVYRVKVPGDPGNQAVSSSLFPIEVTPAPPSLLRPRPSAKLPSEGKVK
jgi:hypothetical protein